MYATQVSNTCEKQMASQHKLAQSVRTNYSNIMEGSYSSCITLITTILSMQLCSYTQGREKVLLDYKGVGNIKLGS